MKRVLLNLERLDNAHPWGLDKIHKYMWGADKNYVLLKHALTRTFCPLRHAVQLLSPASIVAKLNGREEICKVMIVSTCQHLFVNECTLRTLFTIKCTIFFTFWPAQHTGGSRGSVYIVSGCQVIGQAASGSAGEVHFMIFLPFQNFVSEVAIFCSRSMS